MSDDLTATLTGIRAIEQAATEGPWWSDETDQVWRLHGVGFRVPPQRFSDGEVLIPEQAVSKQILKAPKQGTPYAEYWPDAADAEFIVTARTAMPRLLAAVERLSELADEWDAKSAEIWAQIQIQDCDAASAGFKAIGATRYKEDAKAVREAITAALTGAQLGEDEKHG